jgi:hypothetical protein
MCCIAVGNSTDAVVGDPVDEPVGVQEGGKIGNGMNARVTQEALATKVKISDSGPQGAARQLTFGTNKVCFYEAARLSLRIDRRQKGNQPARANKK